MSAKQLSAFTAELRSRNISRPNLYYIELTLPPLLMRNRGDSNIDLVSMWCHMAQTPQTTILTQDNHIEAGVRRKYAYDQDYQNLTLSFYVDQDYKIKQFFDQWKSIIVPQNRNFGYPDDYTANSLNLYIINQEDESTYKYEYSRIFPKSINAIELSYENGNTYSTFSVDFVFEEVFYSTMNGKEVITVSNKPSGISIAGTSPEEISSANMNKEILMQKIPTKESIISGIGGQFGGASGNW